MKTLFFSFALASALAIPALASEPPNLISDCTKGEGKCTTEFYNITGTATVTLSCMDGSTIYDYGVGSPNAQIACEHQTGSGSQRLFWCDFKGQNITYDINSHLKCK